MKILIILAIIVLTILAIIVCRKLVESVVNLIIISRKKNALDLTKHRNGIVYNKKEKKLEADNSVILPF